MKLWRPKRLRKATSTARSCKRCAWMSQSSALCWRYLYDVKPTQTCDRFKPR